jgi:DNA-binding Lrp family transcriptional regulator
VEKVCFLVSAYVLVKVEAGKDRTAFKEVKTIEGVKRVSITYGTFDLVIEVSFERIQELDRFVFHRLRVIPQIRETMTIICSETEVM